MTCTSFKFSALILVAAVISLVAYGRRFNSGVYIDANGNQIVFSNFVAYLDSFLNVSAMVSKFTTTSEDCQNLCMLTTSCLSVNVALTPDDKGRKLCQMLSTTKDIKPDHFGPSKAFYHLTTIVSVLLRKLCSHVGNSQCIIDKCIVVTSFH